MDIHRHQVLRYCLPQSVSDSGLFYGHIATRLVHTHTHACVCVVIILLPEYVRDERWNLNVKGSKVHKKNMEMEMFSGE